jgi:hypothetical protein
MNLRNILQAHREAVTFKEQAAKQLEEVCHEIDEVINCIVKPVFDQAEREISEMGFDVKLEVESRMLESHNNKLRFTAACVLTAGMSIPASTLTFDGNPRTTAIEFTKVVGGLRHEERLAIQEVTMARVERELEQFVAEVFPSDLW